MAAAVSACTPLALRESTLRLRPFPESNVSAILDPDMRTVAAAAIQRHTSLDISIDVLDPGRAARDRAGREDAYRNAQEDPVVRDLLKRFQAEIIAREPMNRTRWLERHSES